MAYAISVAINSVRKAWTDIGVYGYQCRRIVSHSCYSWRIFLPVLIEAMEDEYGTICMNPVNDGNDGMRGFLSHMGEDGSRMHSVIWIQDNDTDMIKFTGMYKSMADTVIELSSYGEARSCVDHIIRSMGERKAI